MSKFKAFIAYDISVTTLSKLRVHDLLRGTDDPFSFFAVFLSMSRLRFGVRARLAAKLQNPRLLQIHLHTLRHWKATMEYHRTKDVFHVKELLCHKKLDNVAIYVQIDKRLFNETDEGFTCRVAHNVGEAIALTEAGFEYVTGEYNDGGKIFRKRK